MAPLIVCLPPNLSEQNIIDFLRKILKHNDEPRNSKITLDFARLNFIRAEAIVVLSNVIEYLRLRQIQVEFSVGKPSAAVAFLDDSGFFQRYLGRSLSRCRRPRETTIPLKLVRHAESFSFLEHEMIPWLRGRTGYPASSFADLKICLAEIFNNIQDHSGQDIGCLFGQHHPNEKRILIAVSDFGFGIPTTVRKVRPYLDDSQALEHAIAEGFTSKLRPRHRGAGLALLLDNVVTVNKGKMSIYSRAASVRSQPTAQGSRSETTSVLEGSYPGTLFVIELRTDTLPVMEDEREEFEW